MTIPVKIPQRSVYRAAEVCTIAKLQPYVLRSWEAEFPGLGIEQSGGRLRVYRRAHLDMVLRIKGLLFVEGLTLGAARRKILKETPAEDEGEQKPLEELLDVDAQARVEDVKAGLRAILTMLSGSGNGDAVLPLERSTEGDDAPLGSVSTLASLTTTSARRASKVGGKRRLRKA